MNKLIVILMLITATGYGQQDNFKGAFLEKWDNSRDYLLDIAAAMPEEAYDYKPAERQMTFGEQLLHIQGNINWLSTKYFDAENVANTAAETDKKVIIDYLTKTFASARRAIENTPEDEFKKTVDFFAGPKSKLQILNLLHDHLSHHRGQLVVYLNMNNITPPSYSGW